MESHALVSMVIALCAVAATAGAQPSPLRGVVRDSVAVGGQPWRMFSFAGGRELAVLNAKGWVSFVDLESRSVDGRTKTFSDGLFEAALTPDETRLVAWSTVGARVHIVDLQTHRYDGSITVGQNLGAGVFVGSDDRLLIAAVASRSVSLLDLNERRVVSRIRFPKPVGGLAFEPDTGIAAATGGIYQFGAGSIPRGTQVFFFHFSDAQEPEIVEARTIDAGVHPRSAAFVGGWLLVALRGARGVIVVEPKTARVVETLPTGPRPETVVVSPDARRAIVVAEGADWLPVITTHTGRLPTVSQRIELPGKPLAVRFLDRRWLLVALSGRRILTRVHHIGGRSLWGSFTLSTGERATADQVRDAVAVVDLDSGEVVDLIGTSRGPISFWTDGFYAGRGGSVAVACPVDGRIDFLE